MFRAFKVSLIILALLMIASESAVARRVQLTDERIDEVARKTGIDLSSVWRAFGGAYVDHSGITLNQIDLVQAPHMSSFGICKAISRRYVISQRSCLDISECGKYDIVESSMSYSLIVMDNDSSACGIHSSFEEFAYIEDDVDDQTAIKIIEYVEDIVKGLPRLSSRVPSSDELSIFAVRRVNSSKEGVTYSVELGKRSEYGPLTVDSPVVDMNVHLTSDGIRHDVFELLD